MGQGETVFLRKEEQSDFAAAAFATFLGGWAGPQDT